MISGFGAAPARSPGEHAVEAFGVNASGRMANSVTHALLLATLSKMLASHTRRQLDDMIAYQLDNLGEDEFVITRGG